MTVGDNNCILAKHRLIAGFLHVRCTACHPERLVPLSVMVLVSLSVPLTRMSPRMGRYGRLVMPMPVFIIYFNLTGTVKSWDKQGVIPPVIGIWWVHLLLVLPALFPLIDGRLVCRTKRRS